MEENNNKRALPACPDINNTYHKKLTMTMSISI